MKWMKAGAVAAALATTALMASPALAQKSAGVMRVAQTQTIGSLDYYLDARPEVAFLRDMVFDSLIAYDFANREFVPHLAESWTLVDDTTIDMKLREDVTWHDGEPFTADDVVYTINYLIDPNVPLNTKSDYVWISSIEKLGDYEVRIHTDGPHPSAFNPLANHIHIYPQHIHEPLADKIEFGRAPVGTGPYRVTEVDRSGGIRLEQVEGWVLASDYKTAGTVERFHVFAIPDAGARVAGLLAGNIDVTRDIPFQQAAALDDREGFSVTLGVTGGINLIRLDMSGKAGVQALTDERVRRAILMAINKRDLLRVAVGRWADDVPDPGAFCEQAQVGCSTTVEAPAYDPEGAKRLMEEAGVSGFNVTISSYSFVGTRMAEAVSGQLRPLGINVSVEGLTFAAYRDKLRDGQVAIVIGGFGGGGDVDVQRTIDFQFGPGDRNYHNSQELMDAVRDASTEMDSDKRAELTEFVFDWITENSYSIPLTRFPNLWVHTDEVTVEGFDRRPIVPVGLYYDFLSWN